ncbi:hypothetical protein O7627_13440 [Solwaraspora sp. WMMD1047]|uniref:hypothetical protein n=1 Tax=Solwaraspora sp. WMMD1047 TaxID=3016102 RepID=UPI002415ED71|nr:hypothetical protein [Solwaraspora sp. WMMD1047]MDG4830303.1 hypothetical protein [Solwaraspora sp. WMMD1047]
MTVDRVTSAVGTQTIDASIRALGSFTTIDYADLFTLATEAEAGPQWWARAMFGDAPDLGELFIWRVLLGLRLRLRPSPETVAGWRIGGRGENWIRLETDSWLLTANLVVVTAPGRVSLATFLRYDHGVAQRAWPPLSAVHRHLVPGVLRAAESRVAVGPRPATPPHPADAPPGGTGL